MHDTSKIFIFAASVFGSNEKCGHQESSKLLIYCSNSVSLYVVSNCRILFLQHKQRFNSVDSYQKLALESDEFWKSLMHGIQKKHKIIVQGVPSVKLQKEMADEEKKRIAKQVRIDSVIYNIPVRIFIIITLGPQGAIWEHAMLMLTPKWLLVYSSIWFFYFFLSATNFGRGRSKNQKS